MRRRLSGGGAGADARPPHAIEPARVPRAGAGSPGATVPVAMVTAFLLIVCEPQRIHDVGQALADMEGVDEVYTTTGSTDFVAVVRVPDLDALAALVTERVAREPGIVRTDTHLAMRSYGRKEIQAAYDIGLD